MSRYHCSKILRSRNFASMVTWRNNFSLLQTVLLVPNVQNTYIFFLYNRDICVTWTQGWKLMFANLLFLYLRRYHAERAISIIKKLFPEDHLLLASSKSVKGKWGCCSMLFVCLFCFVFQQVKIRFRYFLFNQWDYPQWNDFLFVGGRAGRGGGSGGSEVLVSLQDYQ